MAERTACPSCHQPMEPGFVSTSNGSGLFWSHSSRASRLRPDDLEVLVPTGFGGTYSANLAAERCVACKKVLATVP
jgi:hypothetical protein